MRRFGAFGDSKELPFWEGCNSALPTCTLDTVSCESSYFYLTMCCISEIRRSNRHNARPAAPSSSSCSVAMAFFGYRQRHALKITHTVFVSCIFEPQTSPIAVRFLFPAPMGQSMANADVDIALATYQHTSRLDQGLDDLQDSVSANRVVVPEEDNAQNVPLLQTLAPVHTALARTNSALSFDNAEWIPQRYTPQQQSAENGRSVFNTENLKWFLGVALPVMTAVLLAETQHNDTKPHIDSQAGSSAKRSGGSCRMRVWESTKLFDGQVSKRLNTQETATTSRQHDNQTHLVNVTEYGGFIVNMLSSL